MTNHGDDCYFFYYSNCAKGESCPFRHCEDAMGSEVVCSLWQESRCFRQVCKFRHMEIKKNRKEIACYWENQPAGCQKPHCAFHHEKPRFIEGQYVQPNKSSALKEEEEPHEVSLTPVPIPSPANPQLRGVIKAETQENVPSPTHPPVVINPADDEDEDEDDQLSEGEDSRSGSEGSRVLSPRKMAVGSSSDDSLDFGVRTLEEIRLRKALKASMRRAVPGQGSDQWNNGTSGEKENMRSFIRPSLFTAKDDTVVFGEETGRRNVADRLGKRIVKEVPAGGDLPIKRCLAERLGKKMDKGEMDLPPQKALKPVRDRLGLPVEPTTASESAESHSENTAPEVIRIKTLEEIRQEKLTKSQGQAQGDDRLPSTPDTTTSTTKAPKRGTTGKPAASLHVKTFSEILHAKRKLEENQQQGPSLRKAKQAAMEAAPGNSQAQGPTEPAMPSRVAPPGGEVKVKTLEEIRREKAAKMQARGQEASNGKSPGSASGEAGTKKPLVLRINKAASPASSTTTQKTSEVTKKTEKQIEPSSVATEASPANSRSDAVSGDSVKVKTFEEIMREKRLRRQQLQEEQASSTSQPEGSAEADSFPKQATGPALQPEKRALVSPPAASSSPPITLEAPAQAPKAPLRQRITLKPKAASPVPCATASPQQGSPLRQAEADSPSLSPRSFSAAPGKRKRGLPGGSSPPKQAVLAAAASPGPSVKGSPVEKAQDGAQKKSPGQATEAKVRPKLNVRPSVMKLAAQVKPGQKRTSARSAVAAVKPLNSTYAVQEEPLQELSCKQREVSSTSSSGKAQVSPVVSRRSPAIPGPGLSSSPLREEFQAVPVNQHSPAITTAAPESCIVPQSPGVNTPIQPKPRRPSIAMSRTAAAAPSASSSTSAMDEFDELMNEFTDDRLEDDLELDPGKGEDDYLLELSEMIDS